MGLKMKRAISVLVCLQMGLEPLSQAVAASSNPAPLPHVTNNQAYKDTDPVWQKFADTKTSPESFNLEVSPQEPSLDRDPFFMRSQSWGSQNIASNGLNFKKSPGQIEITVPGTGKSLTLRVPLTPIQSTAEFIFFSLDEGSDLFQKAVRPDQKPGEGIFFLNRNELAQQAANGKPAPLFFFPLSGSWTGSLSSLELPQSDMLMVANKTESVALELRDVESVMKAEQINLMMAAALSAKNRQQVTNEMYPAPGMTAAFGMFFTGLDLEMKTSLWAQGSQPSPNLFDEYVLLPLVEKWSRYFSITEQTSHAFTLPPPLVKRLVFVGSVLTGMLLVSVGLKYLHPGIRKQLQAKREGQPATKNPLKIIAREVRETFDVFAPVSTTVSQFPLVTFANCLELFLDKFAPTVAASNHTLLRNFLNYTFYRARNNVKKLPTDSKTFTEGSLVLGGIDTGMVAIQYEIVVPWIAEAASHHVGADMQARIEKTFDPHNPNTKEIALQDEIRNGVAYLQVGAFSSVAEARGQVTDPATREVIRAMKAQGMDPDDPKNQSYKEKEIDRIVDVFMKRKGFPSRDQFMFDANTLFQKIPKALGYRTPEGAQAQQSYILQTRFGLTKNALNRALEVANQWAKQDSSAAAQDAAQILRETLDGMSFLKNGIANGKAGLQKARDVRQQLTLLSYEGKVEYGLEALPETWSKKYSAEAAQAAGLFFRQSLYSFLTKEGDNLVVASPQSFEAYGQEAKANALKEVLAAHPELKDKPLTAEAEFELKLRTQVEINRLARAADIAEKAEKYAPPKMDWIALRKQTRAQAETADRLARFVATPEGATASEQQLEQLRMKFFAEAMGRQVGLHIEDPKIAAAQGRKDYIDLLNYAEEKAQAGVESETTKDPNTKRYLEKLSAPEQIKMKMFLYANHYFIAYKEGVGSQSLVGPIDPAQPGRFQRLRQTEVVRNSKFLTRALRTMESFGEDQSMDPSLGGVLVRNIPLAQDLLNSHRRLTQTILPSLTIAYLWNYYAWQVHMPFSAWLVMQLTAATSILTPSQWLSRVFRVNGLPTDGSILIKAASAFPYAWLTFGGMFVIMLYSGDVGVMFSDYVRNPIMSVLGQISLKEWFGAAAAAGILAAAGTEKVRSDFKKKTEGIKDLFRPVPGFAPRTCAEVFR